MISEVESVYTSGSSSTYEEITVGGIRATGM